MAKRDRGTGSLFTPKGSSVIWCQYYINGKRQRESTGETDKRKATIFLNKKLQEVASGNRTIDSDKYTVADLVEAKLTNERNNGYKSLSDQENRWTLYLQPFFGSMKASKVTTDLLDRYIASRQKQEIVRRYTLKSGEVKTYSTGKYPDSATINRELALLRGSFNLGRKSRKVMHVPYFPMLKESNVRKGFLTDEQYDLLSVECTNVGLWLRTLLEMAATYCWRKSELITSLRVNQIDLNARLIRLNVGETKNDDGREVTITKSLMPLLAACIEGKKQDDYVITRDDGSQVKDFRETWYKVTAAAGVPDLLVHDLRRTGARNLRRAGVAEGVIMKIGGWKTRSVFERYAIVAQSDIKDALAKLEQQREEFSHSSAKEAPEMVQPEKSSVVVN